MALNDLKVYSEQAYTAFTETLNENINLFNAATGGALVLNSGSNQGDFNSTAFYARVAGGTTRRRNAYTDGAVAAKSLAHLEDVAVKVATGAGPFRIDPGQFKWITRNPEEAGMVLGEQMAKDSLADMVNVALGATYSALVQTTAVVTDISADATPANRLISWQTLNKAQAKFGDQSSRIGAWVMHSAALHHIYGQNLNNANSLFSYGTVNVARDPFGKLLIMTDNEQLLTAGTPNKYHVLGLTGGAAVVTQNDDFTANEDTDNGFENIRRTYQAEWSYNLSVKGYAWDKTSGGKSPTNAALFQSANWDKYATDHKDLAGVILTGLVS